MCRGRRARGGGRADPVRALTRIARVAAAASLPFAFLGTAGAQEPLREVRAGPVVVRSAPEHTRAARRALDAVRAFRFPGIADDAWARDSLVVLLAPDVATFRRWARGVPDWGAGAAFPEAGVVVVPLRSATAGATDWLRVLHHEVAHVALRRAVRARIPAWFDEGYAQWASGSWDAESAWQLRIAFLLGRTPPLDSLTLDAASRPGEARWAYLLAYTAVQYLHELSGPDAFARLLERWRAHGSLDAALRETYGLTPAGFERLWRGHVKRRYGWLLIASQATTLWLGLTLLVLGLGMWIRHRRRLQYAEMARREAARPEEEEERTPETGGAPDRRPAPRSGPEHGPPATSRREPGPSGDPRDETRPPVA